MEVTLVLKLILEVVQKLRNQVLKVVPKVVLEVQLCLALKVELEVVVKLHCSPYLIQNLSLLAKPRLQLTDPSYRPFVPLPPKSQLTPAL